MAHPPRLEAARAGDGRTGRAHLHGHALLLAHDAAVESEPVGRHRSGTRLRFFDLHDTHHRSRPHLQGVGHGLHPPADRSHRLHLPRTAPVVRGRAGGAGRFARNIGQPPANHLLLPAGHRRAADKRIRPVVQTSGASAFLEGVGGAPAGRRTGGRVQLRTALLHRTARRRHHAGRLGTRRGGCRRRAVR